MYGLSKDVDLGFMCGKILLQVCVGVNEIILNFDEDMSITVTANYSQIKKTGEKNDFNACPDGAIMLVGLLHRAIKDARGSPDGTLQMVFDNGESIVLYDNSQKYESYVIKYKGKQIVV